MIETAQEACDEAALQVGVETAADASEANKQVVTLNLELSFLNLATFTSG